MLMQANVQTDFILQVCHASQVSLFSENSSRWLTADQGIMLCGAADAVRGASSPADELAFITRQSDSTGRCYLVEVFYITGLASACSTSMPHLLSRDFLS